MKNTLIGIDLGTTNIKANLMDEFGNLIATSSCKNELILNGVDMAEQDANYWWHAICKILREITSQIGSDVVSSIAGICISSHIVSILPVDKNGEAIRNAIIWMDNRAEEQFSKLLTTIGFDEFSQIIGERPSGTFMHGKMLWYKENEPENFKKTYKFLQASNFIAYKLTGKMGMDEDSASRCQCLDISSKRWSSDLSNAMGIVLDNYLPDPMPITDIIGEVSYEAALLTGLKQGIPVTVGVSDCLASMYATGITKLGDAGESSGTSSMIFVSSNIKCRPDDLVATKPSGLQTVPFIFDAPISCSGSCIQWYLNNFGGLERKCAQHSGLDVYTYLNKLALEANPGSDGLFFFPYMMGERAPLWNSYSKGMFIGMNLNTGRAQLVRAIFEGTAYSVRHVINTITKAGGKANSLRITGGGRNSRTWCEIKASVLNMPVLLLDSKAGDVPFGDVLIAGKAIGLYDDLSEVTRQLIKVDEVIEPRQDWVEVYDKLFPYYIKMYESLDQDLKSLNDTVNGLKIVF